MNFDFNANFEKMMQSDNLDTVIILGHMNPDGDAAGCVMGLAHYIHTVYPQYKVIPHLAETLDKGPKKQVMEDQIFDPFSVPEAKRYAVIICDTATRERIIGRQFYENAVASIVIDHHASDEGYGDINYTRISESCSENIYYALDWDRWKHLNSGDANGPGQHPTAADYIYMGILHDTGRFARANTATFMAAVGLIQLGAEHNYVMKTMHSETLDDLNRRSLLLGMAQRTCNGKVAYVYLDRENSERFGIGYEDIHPISGFLRDCEDIELGFTMYEEFPDYWRCSFRSDGKWIDVNELLIPLGGGGHAGAAGLRKKTCNPEKLREDVLRRIVNLRSAVTEKEGKAGRHQINRQS